MPRRKLVPQLRAPCLSYEYLDQCLIILCIADHNLVYVSRNRRLVRQRRVFVWHRSRLASERVVRGIRRRLLVYKHITMVDSLAHTSKSVRLDDVELLCYLTVFIEGRIGQTIKSAKGRLSITILSI